MNILTRRSSQPLLLHCPQLVRVYFSLALPEIEAHSKSGILSPRGDAVPQGKFGNVWGTFCCHSSGGKECHCLEWVEAREAAQHPTTHRAAPMSESGPAPSFSSADTDKLWAKFST